jgi:hypothetical protein
LRATLEDVEGLDFEAPLADSATKSRLLFDPYHTAMQGSEARHDGRAIDAPPLPPRDLAVYLLKRL